MAPRLLLALLAALGLLCGLLLLSHPHHPRPKQPHSAERPSEPTWGPPTFLALGDASISGAPSCTTTAYALQLHSKVARLQNLTLEWGMVKAPLLEMAAGCARSVIAGAKLLTIDFLIGLGVELDDDSELHAYERILAVARERRVRTVVILRLPGTDVRPNHECVLTAKTCFQQSRQHALHRSLIELVERYGARHITLDAERDRSFFGSDGKRLSELGHNLVYFTIESWLDSWEEPSKPPVRNSHPEFGMQCHFGDDLRSIVRRSDGFSEIDLSRPSTGSQAAPRVGFEATKPGAELSMCVSLPRETARRVAAHRIKREGEASPPAMDYMLALGVQAARAASTPPKYGKFHVGCHGACECTCSHSEHQTPVNCTWESRASDMRGSEGIAYFRVMVKDLLSEQTPVPPVLADASQPCLPKQCRVSVRHAGTDLAEGPVVVRALLAGIYDWRMGWINTYIIRGSSLRDT